MKWFEFYDLNDKPIRGKDACIKWAKQLESNRAKKIVKQEYTWLGFWVSTVWLGLNHNWGMGKPLIYETMVFRGGHTDYEMDRYSDIAEAKTGHRAMIRKWSNPFYIIWYLIRRKFR